LSVSPRCRVCNLPMQCLDRNAQRWYCHRDDEVYYEKENRWQEPRRPFPTDIGREPTRQDLIRRHTAFAVVYSIIGLGLLVLNFLNLSPLEAWSIFLGILVSMLGLILNSLIPKIVARKQRMNWGNQGFFWVFRNPRDKHLAALWVWEILLPVVYIIVVVAAFLRGL